MADRPRKPDDAAPGTPFDSADDDWESELDAWDAALPIEPPLRSPSQGTRSETPARSRPARPPTAGAGIPAARPARPPPPVPAPPSPTPSELPPAFSEGAGEEDFGALPDEEEPFFETPTTVVSQALPPLDIDDLPEMATTGPLGGDAFDDGMPSASTAYAALIATDESAPGLFERDPPREEPPSFPEEALAEMAPGPWREAPEDLVAIPPEGIASTAPPEDYWRGLAALIADERRYAIAAERKVTLALESARVAERLGQTQDAWTSIEEALIIDGAAPVAHRARLVLAEQLGRGDDPPAVDSLARLAALPHADQPYYRALEVERTLARAAATAVRDDAPASASAAGAGPGAEPKVALEAVPEGLGRLLAEAELRWRRPGAAAGSIDQAAHRVGGPLGAALLVVAARLNEAAREFQVAAEQRFLAARLGGDRSLAAVGLLRDIARLDPEPALPALVELLPRFPPSAIKVSLARWAAMLARRAGDAPEARRLLSASIADGPDTAALSRDRLDTADAGGGKGAGALAIGAQLSAAMGHWATPVAAACGALRACELTRAAETDVYPLALTAVVRALSQTPDAAAVAVAAEELAGRAPAPEARARALVLWRDGDPARRLAATLQLADAKLALGDADGLERLLGEAQEGEPRLAFFWRLGARAARRGGAADAAASMERGAAAWDGSALAPALRERAAELRLEDDLPSAIATLESIAATSGAGAGLTLERVLRRMAPVERWEAYVRVEAAPDRRDADPWRRASLLLDAALRDRYGGGAGADEARAALLASALEVVPLHPVALAAILASPWASVQGAEAGPAARVARALADGAKAAGEASARRRWSVAAVAWAATTGDARGALALACAAWKEAAGDEVVRRALAPLLRALAPAESDRARRRTILLDLAAADPAEAIAAVEAAEADEREGMGDDEGAARLLEQASAAASAGVVAADIRAGLWAARGAALATVGAPASTSTSAPTSTSASASASAMVGPREDRLGPLGEAVRGGDWPEVARRLVELPPHEEVASAPTLVLAASIDEARAGGKQAPLWLARAGEHLGALVRLTATDTDASADADAADADADVRARSPDAQTAADLAPIAAASHRLGRAAAAAGDARSAALLLVESARIEARIEAKIAAAQTPPVQPPTPGGGPAVERRFEAAMAADPQSVPAAMAWRRWLLGAGRLDDAAGVLGAEADALFDPALRVRALLRAAGVTLAVPPGAADAARADRAAALFHRALELAPGDQEAFTGLRDLYETSGRHAPLAALLEERIAATPNPFEATSLRLARAELFAGPLADHAAAKTELGAVLVKEPQHARALARLADLELEDGNDAAAAELYIRRAWTERSPEKLRELFLRLGRIYTGRLPDSKRAVGAYARVLQLDANNREALDALSRLYVGLGETKNAAAITERLVRLETAAERRAGYLVRLGQLSERSGDPRAASGYFRRAVEEAPRNLEALGELARFLEKTRDVVGRRTLLDATAQELRASVLASPGDRTALEALAAVLRWRGRAEAAAAAADVAAMLAGELAPDRPPLPSQPLAGARGSRRLAAVTYPAVDERTFPAAVSSSVRQLFRLLAPVLGAGVRPDLRAAGVDRSARLGSGKPPRELFDALATELGSPAFEVFVRPASAPPPSPSPSSSSSSGGADAAARAALAVLPGEPPAVVIDARLVELGAPAVRFAAGRAVRLIATHLDVALAGDAAALGAWLGGIIRQFVPDYQLPTVPPTLLAEQAARVARQLPRKLRPEVMPFAMECSGALDVQALQAGIRDGVNRVGLLASGSAAAALRVVLMGAGAPPTAAAILRTPEALALLEFALSDEHDDLVRSLD